MPETRFVLRVPLDASRVPDFSPDCSVRVLAWSKQGATQQRVVRFSRSGKATASFEFEAAPQEPLRVAVGPENATAFELQRLQTVTVSVPAAVWKGASDVTLPAVQISSWYWWWWQHWRQSFKVTGRVVSSRGVPITGATVSAFDMDAWWWWTTQEKVGDATTDSDGWFSIEFTRSSGWWPWWWWATRDWQTNAELAGRITAFVGQYAKFGALPQPAAVPNLEVFEPLFKSSARPMPSRLSLVQPRQGSDNGAIDPAALEGLRERLVEILPRHFPLPVWPWSRWAPWEDCGANLSFKVVDQCGDETRVLVNESMSDTRWDIPSLLDVTLTTREAGLREVRPGWTLVDYLFPGSRSPVWSGSVSDDPGSVLGRSA